MEIDFISFFKKGENIESSGFSLIELRAVFISGTHAEGIIEEKDDACLRVRPEPTRSCSSECRSREGQDEARQYKRPEDEEENLAEFQFPHFALLELLEESERAELNGAKFSQVQEMEDNGDRNGDQAKQERWV